MKKLIMSVLLVVGIVGFGATNAFACGTGHGHAHGHSGGHDPLGQAQTQTVPGWNISCASIGCPIK